jgi:hypothetical protein
MTTYDVVNFDSTFNLIKNFLGKRLFAAKANYVVQQMRDAIADQKLAISESNFMLANGTENAINSEAKNELDPYNAGWLAGFYAGLIEAEQNAETGIWFIGSQEDYLVEFLNVQRDVAKSNWATNPSEFNEGAVDGYTNWIDGLSGGWVKF